MGIFMVLLATCWLTVQSRRDGEVLVIIDSEGVERRLELDGSLSRDETMRMIDEFCDGAEPRDACVSGLAKKSPVVAAHYGVARKIAVVCHNFFDNIEECTRHLYTLTDGTSSSRSAAPPDAEWCSQCSMTPAELATVVPLRETRAPTGASCSPLFSHKFSDSRAPCFEFRVADDDADDDRTFDASGFDLLYPPTLPGSHRLNFTVEMANRTRHFRLVQVCLPRGILVIGILVMARAGLPAARHISYWHISHGSCRSACRTGRTRSGCGRSRCGRGGARGWASPGTTG